MEILGFLFQVNMPTWSYWNREGELCWEREPSNEAIIHHFAKPIFTILHNHMGSEKLLRFQRVSRVLHIIVARAKDWVARVLFWRFNHCYSRRVLGLDLGLWKRIRREKNTQREKWGRNGKEVGYIARIIF